MNKGPLNAALRRAAKRLKRAQSLRPRVFYRAPRALRGFWDDNSTRVAILAANRVGKTTCAIAKIAKEMINRPGIRCRIVGPTNKKVNRLHGKILHQFLGDKLADGSRWNSATGFNGGNLAVCRNGSTCELCSYEQDPQAHASDSMHIILLDEPPPMGHFEEAEARVFDTNGAVWVTLTAVGRPVKWLRAVIEAGVQERADNEGEGWSFYQVALNRENCPWYTEAQIRTRIKQAQKSPWSYAQRIEGAWEGVSEDRRFSSFGGENVIPLGTKIAMGWPYISGRHTEIRFLLAADHGEAAGHSHWLLVGWQTGPRSQYGTPLIVRVLSEWTNPRRMNYRKEAEAVRDMVLAAGVKLNQIAFAVGDTNIASKSAGAKSMNEKFEQEFARIMKMPANNPKLQFRPAKKGADSITGQLATCNSLLDDDIEGVPCLTIAECCTKVIDSVSHWNGKDDKLKHAADTLRYAVTAIVEESGWEPMRLVAQ